MDDKVKSFADGLSAGASKSQGGGVRGAGPDSAGDPKASGDAVTHATHYTKQDGSREQGGGVKNPFHEV